MSSFFPWMGGKSRQARNLSQLLPQHSCYVEVFSGAANLLLTKEPAGTEVLNDINNELVTLFRIVRWHPRELIHQMQYFTHNRVDYYDYKTETGLTDIQKAARYLLRLKAAFGGLGGTTHGAFGYGTSGRAAFRRTVFRDIRRCHRRLDGVYIENLDFAECIKKYDRHYSIFFCDPPYLETHSYKYKFSADDHKRLADCLKAIKGKFLLTINDHPDIRKLYKKFTMTKVDVSYSVSLDKSPEARKRSELIIANYQLNKKL